MSPAQAQLEVIEALAEMRTRFGSGHGRARLKLLERLDPGGLKRAAQRRRCRDLLLFAAAYPDDAAVRRCAVALVDELGGAAPAGTVVEAPFSLDVIAWLVRRFKGDVEIAWGGDAPSPAFEEFLSLCTATAERDGLLDDRLTTLEWLDLAAGAGGTAHLAWLADRVGRIPAPPEVLDHLFQSLELLIRWRVGRDAPWRFPARRVFHQSGPVQREVDPAALIGKGIGSPAPQPLGAARALIDAARTALAARQRETDPVTYANEREVTLVGLERGIDVALFGMQPQRRLPVESFFGYVAARNGVPVAYGGGWVWMGRAEIGINVFEQFRGGESAYLFGQVLRVYHQHYRVDQFMVDPFQFGAGNTDGIRSGAFWFYFRLGFRPVDPDLAESAVAHWARLSADRSYRTPPAVLRRLATCKLRLDVAGPGGDEAPDLLELGLCVTSMVAARFKGDLASARQWAIRRVRRELGAGPAAGWPPEQRRAFDQLALAVAMIPDLGDWTAAQKRSLVTLMRAKGGPRERDYALRAQEHARLGAALAAVAQGGTHPSIR